MIVSFPFVYLHGNFINLICGTIDLEIGIGSKLCMFLTLFLLNESVFKNQKHSLIYMNKKLN
jgi:hypothetical protein